MLNEATQTGLDLAWGGVTDPPAELRTATKAATPRRLPPEFEFLGFGPDHQHVMYQLELELLRERERVSPHCTPRRPFRFPTLDPTPPAPAPTPAPPDVRDSSVETDPLPPAAPEATPTKPPSPDPLVAELRRSVDSARNEIATLQARLAMLERSPPASPLPDEPPPVEEEPATAGERGPPAVAPAAPVTPVSLPAWLPRDPERLRIAAEVEERVTRHRTATPCSSVGYSQDHSYASGDSPTVLPRALRSPTATGTAVAQSPPRRALLPPVVATPPRPQPPVRGGQRPISSSPRVAAVVDRREPIPRPLSAAAAEPPAFAQLAELVFPLGHLVHWKHEFIRMDVDGAGEWGVLELGLWAEAHGAASLAFDDLRAMIAQVDVRRRGRLGFWQFLAVQLYFSLNLAGSAVQLRDVALYCSQTASPL